MRNAISVKMTIFGQPTGNMDDFLTSLLIKYPTPETIGGQRIESILDGLFELHRCSEANEPLILLYTLNDDDETELEHVKKSCMENGLSYQEDSPVFCRGKCVGGVIESWDARVRKMFHHMEDSNGNRLAASHCELDNPIELTDNTGVFSLKERMDDFTEVVRDECLNYNVETPEWASSRHPSP